MNVSFVSSQDIIDGINKTLKNKTDAVINIINDKLTVSVFALLEQNLRNVKEINFIIRDSILPFLINNIAEMTGRKNGSYDERQEPCFLPCFFNKYS